MKVISSLVLSLLFVTSIPAATFSWVGPNHGSGPPEGGDYSDANNWMDEHFQPGVPGSADTARFSNGAYTVTASSAQAGTFEFDGFADTTHPTLSLSGNGSGNLLSGSGGIISGAGKLTVASVHDAMIEVRGGKVEASSATLAASGVLYLAATEGGLWTIDSDVEGAGFLADGMGGSGASLIDVKGQYIATANSLTVRNGGVIQIESGDFRFAHSSTIENGDSGPGLLHVFGNLEMHGCFLDMGFGDIPGGQLRVDGDMTFGGANRDTLNEPGGGHASGSSSSINVAGKFVLGSGPGDSSFLLRRGAALNTGSATISEDDLGTGAYRSLQLQDTHTVWTVVNGPVVIADKGNAQVDVSGGASMVLGRSAELTIAGGENSRAQVTFRDNGTVLEAASTAITLGESGGANGSLSLSNGAELNAGDGFTVGEEGIGSFQITSGSQAVTGAAEIGSAAGARGIVTLAGASSAWTVGGDLTVGSAGQGILGFQDQNTLTLNGKEWVLGEKETGNGQVTMFGPRSVLAFQGELKVGAEGAATFYLRGGANTKINSVTISESRKSTGLLQVDGRNSRLQVVRDFTSGGQGNATIVVTNGASLWIDADASLASELGSLSVSTITSNSVLQVLGDLSVGEKGIASMTIEAGSQLLALGSSLTLGEEAGAGGTLTLGSQLTNVGPATLLLAGELKVGERGNGQLILTNGGLVFPATNQNPIVTLAAERGSVGGATVSGNTSLLSVAVLNVGGTSDEGGGAGSLKLTNGGQGQIAQEVSLWPSGSLDVAGGALTIGQTNSAPSPATVTVSSGGTLRACGAVIGRLLNAGGKIEATCLSESLRVTGDFEQMNPGSLRILLDSSTIKATAPLIVSGNVGLAGTLSLAFTNGFAPGPGDSLCLIQFGTLTGRFDHVEITGLAAGFQYDLRDNGLGTYRLVALNQGSPTSPPALSLERTSGQLQLVWPTAVLGFTLQSTTNLSGVWADVPGAATPQIVPAQGPARFFRLHRVGN